MAPTDETGRQAPGSGDTMLPAEGGWKASLVYDGGSIGIWRVAAVPLFEQYGSPEVIGLDDAGRCKVLISYSGRWTLFDVIHDQQWLGGLAHGDVDPRVAGRELYVGGQRGDIYQLVPYHHGALDARLIAYLPGLEVYTLVAADVVPARPGEELLVFTRPGALHLLSPTGPDGTFEVETILDLPGIVRDAVVLPHRDGEAPEIATVSRAGRLELLRWTAEGPVRTLLHHEAMGLGRIALREGDPRVLYSTADDGRIFRHERGAGDAWTTETIYAGPQGPRGIASGRFAADPEAETVAVFGYSGRVELLTRPSGGGAWAVETIFTDRDKGHWLATAELDGRNATREILGSGYGGRIFLLARPPGFGRGDDTAAQGR